MQSGELRKTLDNTSYASFPSVLDSKIDFVCNRHVPCYMSAQWESSQEDKS